MQNIIALRPQRSPQPTLERSLASAIDIGFTQERRAPEPAPKGIPEQASSSIKPKIFSKYTLTKSTPPPAPQPQRTIRQRDHSPRLEALINRCQNNSFTRAFTEQRLRPELEYLGVAQRSDGRYQIICSGTRKPFLRQIFATTQHCWRAALELEELFHLDGFAEGIAEATREIVEAIVWEHLQRERVELELAG